MDRNKVYIVRTELDSVTSQVVEHIHVASDMIEELNETGIVIDRELFFEALEEGDNQVAIDGFGLFWVGDEGTTLHFVPASSVNECISQTVRFREVKPDFAKVKASHELAGHELQMLQSKVSAEILDCLHLRPNYRGEIPTIAWKPKGDVNLEDVVGLPYNTRIPAGGAPAEGHIVAAVLKADERDELVGWDVRECDTTGDNVRDHYMHYMGTAGSKLGNVSYYRTDEFVLEKAREVRITPNSPRTEKIVVDNFLEGFGDDYAELYRHDRVTQKKADERVENAVKMGLHVTDELKEATTQCKELKKQNAELTERVKEEANANVQLKLDIKHIKDTVNAAVNSVLGEGSNKLDSEPNPVVEHLDKQNSNLGKENVALRERAEKAEADAQKWKEHIDKVGPAVVRRGDVIDELNEKLKEAEERADHAADVAKKKGAYIEQVCSERDKFRNEVERLQKQIRELKK